MMICFYVSSMFLCSLNTSGCGGSAGKNKQESQIKPKTICMFIILNMKTQRRKKTSNMHAAEIMSSYLHI